MSTKPYYDRDGVRVYSADCREWLESQMRGGSTRRYEQNQAGMDCKIYDDRNKRSVWTVPAKPYKDAHFATFPAELITPCVLAGCPEGGIVLEPFCGSGTTAEVARENGRKFLGCELNPKYLPLIGKRLFQQLLPLEA